MAIEWDGAEAMATGDGDVTIMKSTLRQMIAEHRGEVADWCKFRGRLRGVLSPIWPSNPGVSNEEILGFVSQLVTLAQEAKEEFENERRLSDLLTKAVIELGSGIIGKTNLSGRSK